MRYTEFKLRKQAADPDYSALRRRYFEEVSSPDIYKPTEADVAERMRNRDTLRQLGEALKERGRIKRFLKERMGWNNDDEPKEYWDLMRKVDQLYSNALLARYLPRKGVLDLDKIRKRERAEELLGELPLEYVRSTPIPKRELRAAPKGVYINPKAAESGYIGKTLQKLMASGAIRTYGDWIDAVDRNYKEFPKHMREDYVDWKKYNKMG